MLMTGILKLDWLWKGALARIIPCYSRCVSKPLAVARVNFRGIRLMTRTVMLRRKEV